MSPRRHCWRKERPRSGAFVGGFVVDGGVHLAHIVRKCVGMPIRVKNSTACFDKALHPIDSAVAALEFDDGLLGTWTSCFSSPYGGPMLRVFGAKGYAELGWDSAVLFDLKGKKTVYQAKVDSFYAQFDHFVDVVCKGSRVAVSPEDALLDLAFMESIVKGR